MTPHSNTQSEVSVTGVEKITTQCPSFIKCEQNAVEARGKEHTKSAWWRQMNSETNDCDWVTYK